MNDTQTYQFLAGFEGEIGDNDMTWEAYLSHGSTNVSTLFGGVIAIERYRYLINLPNYGRKTFFQGNPFSAAALRAALCAARRVCPSLRHFAVTQDCIDGIVADLQSTAEMDQNIAEVNVQGKVVDMPAGEARFAAGVSYRENSYDSSSPTGLARQTSFLDGAVGIFPGGNSAGETSASDIYGELLLPLIADKGVFDQFNLELGYRHSDNDPTDSVETYKIMVDWRVNDKVRVRGGRNIANRAPNIGELFDAKTQIVGAGGSVLGDLCWEGNTTGGGLSANPARNPNAAQVKELCRARMGESGFAEFYNPSTIQPTGLGTTFAVINNVGNPNLDNETAESITLGAVIRVGDRTSFSIDVYQIALKNMIAAQSVDSVYTQCFSAELNPTFDPATVACQMVQRDPGNGARAPTDVSYTNASRLETNGVDVQFDWGTDLGPGNLNLSFLTSYLHSMKTAVDPQAPFREWQGTFGPSDLSGVNGGAFEYRTFTTVSYSSGPWNVGLRWRHLPSIKAAATITGNTLLLPTKSYDVFDLSGGFNFSTSMTLRYGIDNLLDTDPQITDRTIYSPGAATNAGFYDVLGRRAYVALGLKF